LPESPAPSGEILEYYRKRFGVPGDLLQSLHITVNKDEIWATTADTLAGIRAARPMGLRIGRSFPSGLKPTSVFLAAMGPFITRSRVPLDLDTLRELLLGHRVPYSPGDEEGFVALEYCGDVLGCGRVHRAKLQALIPTGRRRELLEILTAQH
jgi:NOL1/NOP2/fmu family ribosome biogenesis protein